MSRNQLLDGIGTVYDFFVESRRTAEAHVFNIGGGLPAKYGEEEKPVQFEEYAAALRHRCPDLFASSVSLVTEFGRSGHASCGWVASSVEYFIENGDGVPTLLVNVGADMFLGKAYRPTTGIMTSVFAIRPDGFALDRKRSFASPDRSALLENTLTAASLSP